MGDTMPDIAGKLSNENKEEATEKIHPHGDSPGKFPNLWKCLFQGNRNLEHGLKLRKHAIEKVVHLSEEDVLDTKTVWKATLIGYVVGKPTDAKDIDALRRTWKVSFQYMKHPSGWNIFKFDTEEHKQSVLANGPYSSSGFPWIMKDIPPYFSFNDESFSYIPVWVTLPGLPMECWSDSALGKITSQVGDPITTDRCTAYQLRVSFARVLVEVDARKELVRNVPIKMPNGEVYDQSVLYEFEPKLCATCNRVGHSTTNCRSAKKSKGNKGQRDNQTIIMARATPSARPTLFGTSLKPIEEPMGVLANAPKNGDPTIAIVEGTSFGPSPNEAYPKKAIIAAKEKVAKGIAGIAAKGAVENSAKGHAAIAENAVKGAAEYSANGHAAIAENAAKGTAAKGTAVIAANAAKGTVENSAKGHAAIAENAAKGTAQNQFQSLSVVEEILQEIIQPTPSMDKEKQKIDFSDLQDLDVDEKQMALYPKGKAQKGASTSKKSKKGKN